MYLLSILGRFNDGKFHDIKYQMTKKRGIYFSFDKFDEVIKLILITTAKTLAWPSY